MFGSKMESSQDEQDLEDGEIASDEEGNPEPAAPAPAKPVEEKKEEKPVKVATETPPKAAAANKQDEGGMDFAKELQKLKEDFERKKDGRRESNKKRGRETEERSDKRRKRRQSEESNTKNRKEKKRKVEGKGERDEEDIDEDEMLCVRGASPTLNLDKTEVWSAKQPILEPNWHMYEDDSENESDFEDRDDRKRRRRDKEKRGFKSGNREDRDIKKRVQMKRKGKNRKDDNSHMICINFMKGNCNKGSDCPYSHAVCPPKKMELCKFYLMDCCAKRDKCLYLHDEFPCKFFHTGMKCYAGKKCKFSHDPLNSLSKDILLKHLETAPKEILGDFPRLSRDCAETMVNNKTTGKPPETSKIPSLFDIQVSIPPEFQSSGEKSEERTTPPCSPPPNVKSSPKTKPKEGPKMYKETETSDNEKTERPTGSPIDFAKELEAYKSKQLQNKSNDTKKSKEEKVQNFDAMAYFSNSLSSANQTNKDDQDKSHSRRHRKHKDEESEEKSGKRKRKHEDKHKRKGRRKDDDDDGGGGGQEGAEKTDEKKSKRERRKKDSETSNEKSPVRLSQDGSFGGIKFKIINRKEICKPVEPEKDVLLPLKIEKPNEFLSSDDEKPLNYFVKKDKKEEPEKFTEEQDTFGVEIKPEIEDETDENETENALVIETNDDQEEEDKVEVPKHLPKKQQELFLRIQAQQNQKIKEEQEKRKKEQELRERKSSIGSGSGSDAEVGKTPSPEPADENWYSSDDEEAAPKKENPIAAALKNLGNENVNKHNTTESSRSTTPPLPKPKIEITALKDLSRINITELLSSIRQVTSKSSSGTSGTTELKPPVVPPATSYEPPKIENPVKINYFNSDPDPQPTPPPEPEPKGIKDPRLRDPRVAPSEAKPRRTSDEKTSYVKSIYDSANFKIETQDSDLRFQSKFDSDERIKNLDSIVPYGDVDLRTLGGQSDQPEGDFDLRKFGLPFKPVPIHSAATEIDASLNSHTPIAYKVETILIPRPDFSSIKISPNDPQVKKDPRLRRLFRINSSDSDAKDDAKKSCLPSDPRQRKQQLVADTPKSPTESPFSPKQSDTGMANNPLLNANLLLLAQLGLSAAAGNAVFDPRIQQLLNKTPQELDMLRNQFANVKNQSDMELFRNQIINNENPDMMRGNQPNPGLLPTPGIGLLGPAPGFMMGGMGMPDPSVMMGPMGPMGQNPMNFDPRFAQNNNEEDMNDTDIRHFNRNFRNERRGRGSWRGNRDRNWDRDSRRHKRDDRDRSRHNRERDDRRERERKRSCTPD